MSSTARDKRRLLMEGLGLCQDEGGMLRGSMMLPFVTAVVSLLVGCGASSFVTGRPKAEPWVEVVTPHYVVATDLFESRARAIALELEDSRAALLAAAWPGAAGPPGRTRVLVFERQKDLYRYTGMNNLGVVFTRAGFERLLAFTPGRRGGVPIVAKHEIAHDLSRWFLPVQPLWLAEGLALYLESIQLDRSNGRAVMGQLSPAVLGWLRTAGAQMSTSELFASRVVDSADPRDVAAFYAGSLSLVHYLLDKEPKGFGQFQRQLMRLTPWRRAWQASFPSLTHAELDRKRIAHFERGWLSKVPVRVSLPVVTPMSRALTAAEVRGTRALLANASGIALGESEMRAALALDPYQLDALTVHFHSPESRPVRTEVARRAVAAHPEDGEAWLLVALAATEPDDRRRALAEAARRAPHHPGVAELLAEQALADRNPRAALEHVRFAQQFAALAGIHCADPRVLEQSAALAFERECMPPALSSSEWVALDAPGM
jgi:hypothetical protein